MSTLRATEDAAAAAMQDEVAKLQAATRATGEQGRLIAEALARERAELDALRAQIAEAESSATASRAELERLRGAVELRRAAIEARRTELAPRAEEVGRHVAALEALEVAFADALGLRFDLHGGVLRVTFTLIDRRAPADCYSFGLACNNTAYSVLACSPRAPDDLDAIVARLNESADLCAFLCTMRSRFQAMAAQPPT
jgi:hypothetical protein